MTESALRVVLMLTVWRCGNRNRNKYFDGKEENLNQIIDVEQHKEKI